MKKSESSGKLKIILMFSATIVVTFLLGLLAASIIERRSEKNFVYKPMVQLTENEPRNEIWGLNYPLEYQSYIQTADTSFRSKHGGSATHDMLAENPSMVILWAGYAFSKDYKQGRGHYYAIDDIRNTLRTGAPMGSEEGPQPSTCWSCKSPDVPRMMAKEGVENFYKGKWARLGAEIVNLIGCADCHDPQSMSLRITRPALIEAYQRMGKDIKLATHQEMRSLVCAQCHVEYYFSNFNGKEKYLTFPWDNGFTVEAIEEYYDKLEFSDWTHQLSKAPMLKAQHPDFELYSMGVHGDRGVSCADCHMPYRSEGGQKFTDHHIQSPLNNVANSCQVCHREEAGKLISNVIERQDKISEARSILEQELVKAHIEAGMAWEKGAKEGDMKDILIDIRHAQWRWDYSAASHGASFHAPVETQRIIAKGLEKAVSARVKLVRLLARLGQVDELKYPDLSTKEKAQKYIGIDLQELNQQKAKFKEVIIPQWVKQAKSRESEWKVTYL